MVDTRERLTEEEFMALPDEGRKFELVDGETGGLPTGGRHGWRETLLIRMSGPSADDDGRMFGSGTGFRMESGNIRSPGVSFIRFEGLPEGEAPAGFIDGAPDLCIETITPSEDPRDSWRKVGEYFQSGASEVWRLFPDAKRAVIYHSMGDIHTYVQDETLDAGPLLPGFQCRAAEPFAGAAG
jgi:Uma2 family endonuclease